VDLLTQRPSFPLFVKNSHKFGGVVHREGMKRNTAADVRTLSWAADQLGIGVSTAYRLAPTGAIPGTFKVGGQWRVSVPRFLAVVHGVTKTEAQ